MDFYDILFARKVGGGGSSAPETATVTITNETAGAVSVMGFINPANFQGDRISIPANATVVCTRLAGTGPFIVWDENGGSLSFKMLSGGSWVDQTLTECDDQTLGKMYISRNCGVYSGGIFSGGKEVKIV